MNPESNSKIQVTQSGKSTSYKRAHRAKRPVLVTEQASAAFESAALEVEEMSSSAPVAVEEKPSASAEAGRRRGPRFFSSVDKAEKVSDQPKADPIAARLGRALRGKSADTSKEKETLTEKKASTGPVKAGTAVPARPKSGFKMKYIWGMMIYLLIADFLGVWISNWMKTQGLDAVIFTTGTPFGVFQASRSTLVFLALLVIILVLMARFDLIPRSFGAALSGSSSQSKGAPKTGAKTPTFETREAPPIIKQGIKGSNDDLYREYRENQRYFQKRDRKR
jgi:hypothetical protein